MAHAALEIKLRCALNRRSRLQRDHERRSRADKGIISEDMPHGLHLEGAYRHRQIAALQIYVKEHTAAGNDQAHTFLPCNTAVHPLLILLRAANAQPLYDAHSVLLPHRKNAHAGCILLAVVGALLAHRRNPHTHTACSVRRQLVQSDFIGGIREMLPQQPCLGNRFPRAVLRPVARIGQRLLQHRAFMFAAFQHRIGIAAPVVHPILIAAHLSQLHPERLIGIDRKAPAEFHFIYRMHSLSLHPVGYLLM